MIASQIPPASLTILLNSHLGAAPPCRGKLVTPVRFMDVCMFRDQWLNQLFTGIGKLLQTNYRSRLDLFKYTISHIITTIYENNNKA